LPDLEEVFRGKSHLEELLKGRRWAGVRARIKKLGRFNKRDGL
jgi:hypothetical protein